MRQNSYHGVLIEMTVRALWETQNLMDCVPDAMWDEPFGGVPVWEYLYRMLRELDQWFIDPEADDLVTPPFQLPPEQRALHPEGRPDRTALNDYFYTIKARLSLYLTSLHDEDLLQRPERCKWTRFTLMLNQYRHWHLHMGMVAGFVVATTGLCPRTLRPGEDFPTPPYDPYRQTRSGGPG